MSKITMETSRSCFEMIKSITNKIGELGLSLEMVDKVDYQDEQNYTSMIVYEKFYYRTNSYASLSLLIKGNENQTRVDAISSGGGGGIFNISWGSEKNFIHKLQKLLYKEGFREVE